MPVAAGVGSEMVAPAILAAIDLPAHLGRAAGGEPPDHLPVVGRHARKIPDSGIQPGSQNSAQSKFADPGSVAASM